MQQIRQLERTASGSFDYIEDLIERGKTFTMKEFASSINEFLAFRRYDILSDKKYPKNRQFSRLGQNMTNSIRPSTSRPILTGWSAGC